MDKYKIYTKVEINRLTKNINSITVVPLDDQVCKKEKFKQIYIKGKYIPYIISSYGRVFSINYKHKVNSCMQLKTTVDKDGYELIIINYNNESFGFHVHRMVALMFIENPDRFTRTQVNHKNGNKLYNFYFNLEWTTPKENINHAWNHRLAKSSGEMNGNNVYKEKDIKRVCEMIESDYPLRVISEKTGVSYAMISLIYRKKFWTSISDNYDFSKYNYGRLYKNKNIVKICELLEKTNMSIKDIANECGVKRYKINDILRGKSFISISCNYDFSNRNNL